MRRYILVTVLLLSSLITFSQNKEEKDSLNYALMDAAWAGKQDSVLLLIKKGADINVRNDYSQETPLMYAAQQGHLDVVKILLANGASPDLEPINSEGALIRATTMGHLDVVEELIRNGANINQTGKLDRTALHYAASFGYYYITDMLLYYQADIDNEARYDVTPLMSAIAAGYPEIAELLIRKGANPNIRDASGFNALMLASQLGYHKLCGLLIQKGSPLEDTTNQNNTALSLAVINNNYHAADTLLRRNANVNHKLSVSQTPLTMAKSNGSDSLQQLLKSNGARQNAHPYFDYFLFSYGSSFNRDDALFGSHIGLHEVKTNINASLGFSLRYFRKRVINEVQPDVLHQHWEQRFILPLQLDKLFDLGNSYQNKLALFAGLKGFYSWGSYRGVAEKPEDFWGLAPRAGIYWKPLPEFSVNLSYEYMDLHQHTVSPHRISIYLMINGPLNERTKDISKVNHLLRY